MTPALAVPSSVRGHCHDRIPVTEPTVLSSLDNVIWRRKTCTRSDCSRKSAPPGCLEDWLLPPLKEHKTAAGAITDWTGLSALISW